ncbi:MAG: Arginine biosynthesis bifunctional protein ArgJ [Verrucomicrobia subdivision 3 bacterium]|nr:Arginine biosynthesis bifunctional protein ArgJ [Limisphaerales bacterium]MCS1414611.1 Arginine biosynthesis bifunctional protein ArgJ [Limisphaerales bacterium]
MAFSFQTIPGSVTAPNGFRAAGVFCDVKRLGKGKGSDKEVGLDLALIVADMPGPIAGLYTTNQVCAAPVKWCLKRMKEGVGQAIVVNSGNANACTGDRGLRDAEAMATETGRVLGINPRQVLVASTGRIGMPLPMTNIKKGIRLAAKALAAAAAQGKAAAEAIMTSDTHSKERAVEIPRPRGSIRIGGIAKGAGMIDPYMTPDGKRSREREIQATMLSFLTTDIAISQGLLQQALTTAVERSFNSITVDGDMSTNDSVILMANGRAGNSIVRSARAPLFQVFQEALTHVCSDLAKMMVRDGEGASKFVTLRVFGARNTYEAMAAARSVANSLLVKTSWCGGDPNWGRILDALGYSPATVAEEKVDIAYSAPESKKLVYSLKQGCPTKAAFERLCAEVAREAFDLHIHLNLGKGAAVVHTCDLTEAYVDFNKGDISNPVALGG